MTRRMRYRLVEIFMLFALAAAGAAVMPRAAHAGMIGTDQAQQPNSVQQERERVKALLARPELAKQLGDFGVKPQDAAARVDAMTDAEVLQLAGKIDQLAAGGVLTNDQLIVILLLVILLVVLL
jgi:hypothetical protein